MLDRQLQDAINQIEHVRGVVKPIDQDTDQLAQALVDGTKIIITTIQKFPFIMRSLLRHSRRQLIRKTPADAEKEQTNTWRTQR